MISRTHLILMFTLVLADAVLGAWAYHALPPTVPVHWNFHGQVDRHGSSAELAFAFPIIAAAIAGLMLATGVGASGSALQRSGVAFGRFAVAIVALFLPIHVAVLLAASGRSIDLFSVIFAALGFVWMVIGNAMGKIRRNQIMGIRTPWTLKSDVVWERTHRVGGRLQVAHGLAILLAAFLLPAWLTFVVFFAGAIALCVWAMIYSWRLDQQLRQNKVCA